MLKHISLFIIFLIIGFVISVFAYLFFTKEHSQIIPPAPVTSFSFKNAPKESLVGNITTLSGQVLWASRTVETPMLITQPQPIQQGEELVTGATGSLILEFPSAAIVDMQKNADISIIQTLPANIVVEEGKGIVTYQKEGAISISVRGLDLLINIESGQSTISVDKDKAIVTIFVKSGSITLAYTDTSNASQVISAKAGKTIIFDNNTKSIE